jgi:hypothetical protein
MRALLNVSLDDKVCPGVTTQRRYEIVMAAMRICFCNVVGEIQPVTYEGPGGATVHEHCAVVTVEYAASLPSFERGVYHIADSLGQDCISVMHEHGEGRCVGPRADRWGFNPEYFNHPAAWPAKAAA